jgi:hypothetical protein
MVLTLLPTIGGIEAETFRTDLEYALEPLAPAVRVEKYADAELRYEARLTFSGATAPVADALRLTWTDRMMRPAHESHRLTVGPDEVVLDFVTWSDGGHHATGRIVASRAEGDSVAESGDSAGHRF